MNAAMLRFLQNLPIASVQAALRPVAAVHRAADIVAAQSKGVRTVPPALSELFREFLAGKASTPALVDQFMVEVREHMTTRAIQFDHLAVFGLQDAMHRTLRQAPPSLQDGMRRPG